MTKAKKQKVNWIMVMLREFKQEQQPYYLNHA